MTAKEDLGTLIRHSFEVQAAQAVEDKQVMDAQGYFTPDIFFPNNPEGLWAAFHLHGFIKKMGYDSEIAVDRIEHKTLGACLVLQVGKIPQSFLEDIKDFLVTCEVEARKDKIALGMDKNGFPKNTGETAIMQAFEKIKQDKGRGSGGGGVSDGITLT